MAEVTKILNLKRLERRLRRIPIEVRQAATQTLNRNADELVAMQKRLVPVEDGTLQNSIKKQRGSNELQVKVVAGGSATTRAVRNGASATYDYALAQEFGTQDMPANPFFYPSYRALRKRFKGRVTRETRKAIKKAVSG